MWDNLFIPEELASLPNWSAHQNKVPVIKPDEPHKGAILRALNPPHVGLILSRDNPYVVVDLDHPKRTEEEQEVKRLLRELSPSQWGTNDHLVLLHQFLIPSIPPALVPYLTQTYCEFSPSGSGIHVWFTMDKEDQLKAYRKAKGFAGQLSMFNCFMTFTNSPWPGSKSKVCPIDPQIVEELFPGAKTSQEEIYDKDSVVVFGDKPPTWSALKKAMALLKLDQSPRTISVYEQVMGYSYEHYQYWLEVGMALHNFGQITGMNAQCYNLYLEWSAEDPAAYTGEEDVYAKWISFGEKQSPITWKTVFKLANRLELDYPRQTIIKGVPTGNPVTCEYSNFEYLLDRFNLKLHEDDGFYITGDTDICQRYFTAHGSREWFSTYYGPFSKETLAGSVLLLCQDHRWRGLTTTSHLVNTWLTRPRGSFDLFTTWLDTPLDKHPEDLQFVITKQGRYHVGDFNANSNFDYLSDCIVLDPMADQDTGLCLDMVRKQLMHIIKFREEIDLPFVDNGGMLIFIGPENTRKSTFFRMLLPRGLGALRKEMNMAIKGEKGMRDFVRYLGKKTIVQIDEFEGLMNHAKDGSIFKAIISGDSASMTDIYQTTETELPRKAIIVGTSNERHQVLSDNGTRRMWMCQVSNIDTDRMLKINWHTFYNQLREDFRNEYLKGKMPWLLSQEQINTLNIQNRGLAARTDIGVMLETTFPYQTFKSDYSDIKNIQNDKTGQLLNTKAVYDILKFEGHNMNSIKLTALERALERFCGEYTCSLGRTIELSKPKASVQSGKLVQGKYKYWILPPRAQPQ